MDQQQQQRGRGRGRGQGQGHGQEQEQPIIVGGPSELKPVTPEIQAIADSLKSDVEKQLKRTFDVYVVASYKTQVVAGTNYLLKIHCGKDEYLHVTVYEKLPHEGSARSVLLAKDGKSLDDAF